MKLYIEMFKLLFRKFVFKRSNGLIIKNFAETMGIVYIKLAQMLATQNYGNLFTEEDRKELSSICDDCNQISYNEIEKVLKSEYGENLNNIFSFIEKEPIGSASVSQVHRAILTSGEEVAIKIKRKDITKTIDRDMNKIRDIMYKFGKFINFGNFTGGNHALDLYLDWIEQEIDFNHEIENIKTYQRFADSVNGKVSGTKMIKVPKLYEEYCSDNVIVMEFIKIPTVNKIDLTPENKNKIITALNSYIRSSFWAMFNDMQIVFHGDPHSGNICIDEEGNICFLDMGLLCVLSDNDAKLCREFFLTAYSGNYEKLYNMLVPYGNMSEEKKDAFREDCKKYCRDIKTKEVTFYFIDMINVCLNYEFVPPNFLFSMAKAFICLNGISNFSDNKCNARELLQDQTIEFLIRRSLLESQDIAIKGLKIVPQFFESVCKYGLTGSISKVIVKNNGLCREARATLEHYREILSLIISFSQESIPFSENETNNYRKR